MAKKIIAEQTTAQPAQMPIFTDLSAMELIWEKAQSQFETHELEWLSAGALQRIGESTRCLSEIISTVSCLMLEDKGAYWEPSTTFAILQNMSCQMDTISGIAHIGQEAEYRARTARAIEREEMVSHG